MGVPLPGETALFAASILALAGRFSIDRGDRDRRDRGDHRRQRRLPDRPQARPAPARGARAASAPPPRGDRPTASRSSTGTGPRPCSSGASSSGLRITAAWLAGVNGMPWRRSCSGTPGRHRLGGGGGPARLGFGHRAEGLLRAVGLGGAAAVYSSGPRCGSCCAAAPARRGPGRGRGARGPLAVRPSRCPRASAWRRRP